MKNQQSAVVVSFDVVPNPLSFRFIDQRGHGSPMSGTPALLEGVVYSPATRDRIGSYARTGFFITPEHEGNQQLIHEAVVLDGRGTLFLTGFVPGVSRGVDGLSRAVIGGTGEFTCARGEALIELLHGDAFRVTISFADDRDAAEPRKRFDWRGIVSWFFPASVLRARAAMAV